MSGVKIETRLAEILNSYSLTYRETVKSKTFTFFGRKVNPDIISFKFLIKNLKIDAIIPYLEADRKFERLKVVNVVSMDVTYNGFKPYLHSNFVFRCTEL